MEVQQLGNGSLVTMGTAFCMEVQQPVFVFFSSDLLGKELILE